MIALGVHGIGGHGATFEGKGGQDLGKLRDLVGLLGDLLLGHDHSGQPQEGGEKVDRFLESRGTSPKSLAVDGHRLVRIRPLQEPFSENPLEGGDIEVSEGAMDRGPGGRDESLLGGRKEAAKTRQEILTIREGFGPFPQSADVGVSRQDATDRDLENDALGMSDAPLLAGIQKSLKARPEAAYSLNGKDVESDRHAGFSCQKGSVIRRAQKGAGVF